MTIRITDIRIRHFRIPLDPPFRASWDHQLRTQFTATIVEVHTDEGLVGYGSGDSMYGFEQFKQLFIGQEVSQIERHSDVLATLAFHYARYWPLEIALWDVLGAVWRLLARRAAGSRRFCWSLRVASRYVSTYRRRRVKPESCRLSRIRGA